MSGSKALPRPPDFPLAPQDLQRWIRFSAKGGVGRARAIVDRASEDGDKDLMMLEGDEIIVLMDLGCHEYLGHCEGVVGLFRGSDVQFLQPKLKKPVMTPRVSGTKTAVESSASRLGPPASDSLPFASHPPRNSDHFRAEGGDGNGSSRAGVSNDSPKAREDDDRPKGGDMPGQSASEMEGLGIRVRGDDRKPSPQRTVLQSDEIDLSPATCSPDLAGAFQPLSQTPSTPLDQTQSPSYSSDSHGVPSLLTSPYSDTTSHSGPRTPYIPTSEALPMAWTSKELPATPSSDLFVDYHSTYTAQKISTTFVAERWPMASDVRHTKSSISTVSSQNSQKYTLSPPSSAPGSVPGTPGDDPTLAFIFDSYRYSGTPSVTSTSARPSPQPNAPIRLEAEVEEIETTLDGTDREEGAPRQGQRLGAASELRERMRRGQAASALPPHISPTRTRLPSSSSCADSVSGEDYPSRSQLFPRSSTSDSLASFATVESVRSRCLPSEDASHDNGLKHTDDSRPSSAASGGPARSQLPIQAAPQRRRNASSPGVKGLVISPPLASMPTSMWRSHNDSSPVTQTLWSAVEYADSENVKDVFVDSPISSQSHGRFDDRSSEAPSRIPLEADQSRHRHPPSVGLYTPSPSSVSFHSSISTDDVHGSLDHSSAETSDNPYSQKPSIPNKLRKKASFRLRELHSSAISEPQDSPKLPAFPSLPPLPSLPSRTGRDPFYASSPPSSPARQLLRKNSIGSKFSRKSSEKEKDKKVVYAGAGISSKDFEEETVQIGASAFEMVKPYAALLASEEDEQLRGEESPTFEDESIVQDPQHAPPPEHNLLANSLRPDVSTPITHLGPTSSHFSPPTPLSAEGGEQSVQDHRAKEQKWIQTLSSGIPAVQVRKSKKMRSLVHAGIPSSVRGKVWSFLAEADKEKEAGLYTYLCSLGAGPNSAAIEQDVDTLLLDNAQFADGSAGREDLVAVLNAFAHFDRQLGYYPGLANVVGLLLTQMIAEDSFFTLVSLVKNYGFRQFFVVGREELRLETIAFQFLLEMVEPKVARRFRELEIRTVDYLFSWISTLFLSILPLPTVLRVVDVFLLDPKTRYRAPLVILHLAQYTDLDLFPSRDSILNHLLAPPPTAFSPSILIPAIGDYKLSDDKIQKAIKKAAQVMLAPRN